MELLTIEKLYKQGRFDAAKQEFEHLTENNGLCRAFYFLGEIYTHGLGHQRINCQYAKNLFLKGWEMGDPLCGLNYAYTLLEGSGDQTSIYEQVIPVIYQMAEEGDCFAQYELADCYRYGIGVQEDIDYSIELIRRAAESGFVLAIDELADIYMDENDVHCNLSRAIDLLKKGVEFESADACVSLANCYLRGLGVEKDYEKAIVLYKKAYEQGSGDAAYYLALAYKTGKGVNKSDVSEKEWYQKGEENGSIDCQLALIRKCMDNHAYIEAQSRLFKLQKQDIVYDEDKEDIRDLQIKCAKEINLEMGTIYRKMAEGSTDLTLFTFSGQDQLGLSAYHYAILLDRQDLIERITAMRTDANSSVENFNLLSFAVGKNNTELDSEFVEACRRHGLVTEQMEPMERLLDLRSDQNQMALFKLVFEKWDKDYQALYKKYKWNKGVNRVKKRVSSTASFLLEMISSTNADLSNASEEKREAYLDAKDQMSCHADNMRNRATECDDKLEEMENNFKTEYENLFNRKQIKAINELYVNSTKDYNKKLLFIIVSNPDYLERVFDENDEDFEIHFEDGKYWYLPSEIINEANKVKTRYQPLDETMYDVED